MTDHKITGWVVVSKSGRLVMDFALAKTRFDAWAMAYNAMEHPWVYSECPGHGMARGLDSFVDEAKRRGYRCEKWEARKA